VAFLGDAAFHRFVHAAPPLEARPWLIAGGVLVLAGAFQFSELKDRCLSVCRAPGPYLIQHYRRRGPAAAFRLGLGHGMFCLGCCWALMLLMFAAGVANLWWMAALTAVMVYEKIGRHGARITRPLGVALITLGLVTAAHLV
jgi:predicted metal-binding membrane protein